MRRNRRTSATIKKEKFAVTKQYWWAIVLLLAFTCYEVAIHFAEPRLLPIKHIRLIAQCDRVDQDAIQHYAAKYAKGFFSTDVMRLKRKLQENPFVQDVIIKRIWPDTLLVNLTEQRFVALWGDNAVVSSQGRVMQIENPDKTLPKFVGPEGQAVLMLNELNEINKALQPLHLMVKELDLNTRRSWQIKLNNNVKIIMGRKEIQTKLLTLTMVYPKLIKRHAQSIDTIDLRYPNGICVHTK